MKHEQTLNVQCFAKRDFQPVFSEENIPKLLYVGKIRPDASMHPRFMHAHEDFVEVILICSGSSEYLIGHQKHMVRAGDLLIYNAGVVHDEISGPGLEIGSYCVAIGGLHMPGLRENTLIPEDAGCAFPTGAWYEELHTLFQLMFENLSADAPGSELFCTSLMQALLIRVLTLTHSAQVPHGKEVADCPVLGRQIKAYIDAHYQEPITLQSIGQALHISPYYLSHVFKKMSGYSPIQYLLRRRIGEAQTLLITTDLSITRISELVGYETQSYFNLQFTRHVGMSPKRFRKHYIVSAS